MKALMYLTKRSFINNLKKAVRKPVTLLLMIFLTGYGIFIAWTLGMLAKEMHFDSPQGLVVIVTVWTLYIFLADFLAYASRKGVIFRPGHTHFVFTAPMNPKLVLLHSAWMNYTTSIVVGVIFTIAGVAVFGIPFWKMLLFFVAGTLFEIVFECCIMVWLYTNETLPEKVLKILGWGIKAFLIAITLVIILYFRKEGISLESAAAFFDWPVLQMIPFVGWNIAFYRLILLGPTMLNLIGSALYLVSVLGMFLIVWRMPCDGGYYEDAAKFADDYAEMRRKKTNGELVTGVGEKKRSFRKVKQNYQAKGAKAIFYRQLLEYKKEKYFIFSKTTLFNLLFAAIMAFSFNPVVKKTGMGQLFMLGVIAYVTLVMSGYLGKWEKELQNPYLFLIPDKAYKKLWYATVMEHIKALVDGSIICIAIGIWWKVHPVYVVQTILIYTVLQANRLYTRVLAQCLVGDVLGKTGQNIIRMLMQMFILGIGITIACFIGILIHMNLIFPIVLIYCLAVTVMIGAVASIRFDTMEQLY